MSLAHTRLLRHINEVLDCDRRMVGYANCGYPDDMEFMREEDEHDRHVRDDTEGQEDPDDRWAEEI